MAEENGQLTFYAFMYWQKYGRLPRELALIWIETAECDGHIAPTGHVAVYYTRRTPRDLEDMQARIAQAWRGIIEVTARTRGSRL